MVAIALLSSCHHHSKEKEAVFLESISHDVNSNNFIGKHKSKAMVLGVFHFENPGLDGYKPKFAFNILEEKRQIELDTLLSKIAKYKPTKILLEWSRNDMDSIANQRYKNYLNGDFIIDDRPNEIYQIGFKLAKQLEHDKVYCSDAKIESWCGVELDWENYDQNSYLKSRGQYAKSTRYNYDIFYALNDSLKTIRTLTNHLAKINHPENSLKSHQAYLTNDILQGAGDHYLGADVVANWYRRNMRIFSNIYDITDFNKEERLLIIYGSGHVWQLRQLLNDSPDFEYVDVNNYL